MADHPAPPRRSMSNRSHSISSSRNNPMNKSSSSSSGDGIFGKLSEFAFGAVSTAGKITQKGVAVAGDFVTSTADAVGLKDKVEAAESNLRKLATRGRNDGIKAVNKARRLANRAFEFEDGESFNYEYDLLLSNAGAVEKNIAPYSSFSPSFNLPAGNALVYKARVKKWDINLTLREVEEDGTVPVILDGPQRYSADVVMQGRIPPTNHSRTITLFFDNSHSPLQGKTVVYHIMIGENVSLNDDQNSGERTKEMIAAEEGPSD